MCIRMFSKRHKSQQSGLQNKVFSVFDIDTIYPSRTVGGISCMYLIKPLAVASKARNIQQSKLARLTLLFLGDACGSVIQAPNLVPEVFTVSGPVIFISLPHAAKQHTQHIWMEGRKTLKKWKQFNIWTVLF